MAIQSSKSKQSPLPKGNRRSAPASRCACRTAPNRGLWVGILRTQDFVSDTTRIGRPGDGVLRWMRRRHPAAPTRGGDRSEGAETGYAGTRQGARGYDPQPRGAAAGAGGGDEAGGGRNAQANE